MRQNSIINSFGITIKILWHLDPAALTFDLSALKTWRHVVRPRSTCVSRWVAVELSCAHEHTHVQTTNNLTNWYVNDSKCSDVTYAVSSDGSDRVSEVRTTTSHSRDSVLNAIRCRRDYCTVSIHKHIGLAVHSRRMLAANKYSIYTAENHLPRWLRWLRHSAGLSVGGAGVQSPGSAGRFRVRISGAHALRLISRAGKEGSTVSCMSCLLLHPVLLCFLSSVCMLYVYGCFGEINYNDDDDYAAVYHFARATTAKLHIENSKNNERWHYFRSTLTVAKCY